MRTVQHIIEIKEKQVNLIEPTAMVIDALKKLIEVNMSYLIVMENGEYKGLFSERDYTRKLVVQGRSSRETMVGEVMTTNVPEVTLATTAEDCMYRMLRKGSRYLAVFTGPKFEGIVTIHDLIREALANKEEVFAGSLTSTLIDREESGKVL